MNEHTSPRVAALAGHLNATPDQQLLDRMAAEPRTVLEYLRTLAGSALTQAADKAAPTSAQLGREGISPAEIPDDEPIFVLRAQDKLAAEVVRHYAWKAGLAGAGQQLVTSALAHADRMAAWPVKKLPTL